MLFTLALFLLVLWLVIQLWDFFVCVFFGVLGFMFCAGACVAAVALVWRVFGH